MNFPAYTTTELEDWVSHWYKKRRFLYPVDLNIKKIAMEYEIFIHYKPLKTVYARFGGYKEIVINSSLNYIDQREQFFHELCHAVRHVGKQTMMTAAFRELQERDAKHYTLYAALPHHMVKNYNLNDPEIIERWSNDFKISQGLCEERLKQIKRRAISTKQHSKGNLRCI
ncbi:ImmA/IrrE family metallo-endopeptidase [Halobacillus shinanisalinarum]|uniref:ImmA/IrrE family metallo-endopeptidase n=1 Tax=Halobacillus shinanisalinarum TaxID=2932258 RepID=A0ABY4H4X0_9BACI|nr:ImmA/IrrE family metallo-endopeptidase [Halobacillus shinanisalinarum]UOQ95145.1 ImmA/IrrE family metallo-endopeptidase [Halobacillus shinanisalinarum]